MTAVYATVSFVRVYSLRRLFEKFGYDDNFIRLAIKMSQRGAAIIKELRTRNEKPLKTSN